MPTADYLSVVLVLVVLAAGAMVALAARDALSAEPARVRVRVERRRCP